MTLTDHCYLLTRYCQSAFKKYRRLELKAGIPIEGKFIDIFIQFQMVGYGLVDKFLSLQCSIVDLWFVETVVMIERGSSFCVL